MKLLLILFACVCLQKPEPVKKEKKEGKSTKKEAKATYNKLAPSILIINY